MGMLQPAIFGQAFLVTCPNTAGGTGTVIASQTIQTPNGRAE